MTGRSPRLVLLVWWITCLLWSSVWLGIKIGVGDVPPATFASARLVIALLVLLPIIALGRAKLPREPRDWLLVGVTGILLLGLNYAFLYWGAQYVTSGLSAVLQAATPAFGLIVAHVLRLDDERVTMGQIAGLLLGLAGVAAIFADQLHVTGRAALWGCLAVTASALCVALGYVIVKKHGTHLRPIELTTGQMMVGLVPLLLIAVTREGNPFAVRWTVPAIASVLYLALAGSVTAFWLNYWLLKRIGATKLLVMSLVEPLIAVVLGALVLHEAFPAGTLLGGACILASTWMVLAPRRPSAATE
jgi:drug/metabolite transporter (DMT)-like permease